MLWVTLRHLSLAILPSFPRNDRLPKRAIQLAWQADHIAQPLSQRKHLLRRRLCPGFVRLIMVTVQHSNQATAAVC